MDGRFYLMNQMVLVHIDRDTYRQIMEFLDVCHKFTSVARMTIVETVLSVYATDVCTNMLLWCEFPVRSNDGTGTMHVALKEWPKDIGDMVMEIETLKWKLFNLDTGKEHHGDMYVDNVSYDALSRCKDLSTNNDIVCHGDILAMSINMCIGEAPVYMERTGKSLVCKTVFDIGQISCDISMDHSQENSSSVNIVSKYLYFVASAFMYDTMSVRIYDKDLLYCTLLPSTFTSVVKASFKHQSKWMDVWRVDYVIT